MTTHYAVEGVRKVDVCAGDTIVLSGAKWKLSKRQARKVRKRGIASAKQRRSKERKTLRRAR